MMTLTFALFAVASYVLWRRGQGWGWTLATAALILGIVIFMRDVDFSTNLGIQL